MAYRFGGIALEVEGGRVPDTGDAFDACIGENTDEGIGRVLVRQIIRLGKAIDGGAAARTSTLLIFMGSALRNAGWNVKCQNIRENRQ